MPKAILSFTTFVTFITFITFITLFFSCLESKQVSKDQTEKAEKAIAETELKTYVVDSRFAEDIAEALKRILKTRAVVKSLKHESGNYVDVVAHVEPELGRVQLSRNNIILVNAPQNLQKGVPELIAAIEKKGIESIPAMAKMSVWAMAAVPGKGTSSIPKALKAKVEPLQKELPGHCFFPIETVVSSNILGNQYSVHGDRLRMRGDIAALGKDYYAVVSMRVSGNSFDLRGKFEPGEIRQVYSSNLRVGPRHPDLEKCQSKDKGPVTVKSFFFVQIQALQ